ncbi:GNAT family N-acetyltransferase [Propionicicella superfundia]|uniref:GNAT family N-acetyltransferase n=1 Tax=Propionicicella superfundia TaxID=348582 RepID=UPI0004013093|nr:GNAT family N-acetyltransferase [Propionicicella superfundia]
MTKPSGPTAVRLALPREAVQIAAVQRRSWAAHLPAGLAAELLALPEQEAASAWERAISRPPLAQFRVLVAVDGDGGVRGFAAVGPSPDPDADPSADALVAEFVVDPAARRQGHGSRLLNAIVDTLRADGFSRATWWLASTADELRAFVTATGWAPDGAHREVATDSGSPLKEIRLHTSIAA